MTFSNDKKVVRTIKKIMMGSHETFVKYATPLGLHHIMAAGHHYGPGPWVKDMPRADWTSVYYHKADKEGIGFDRTASGSNAIEQYHPNVRTLFESRDLIPDKYLLWFHHVKWNERLNSGRTLWDELCYTYYQGVDEIKQIKKDWQLLRGEINDEKFRSVDMLLQRQVNEAVWWRNSCLLYFQIFSEMPFPNDLEKPDKDLKFYLNLSHPYAPGIRPQW